MGKNARVVSRVLVGIYIINTQVDICKVRFL